MRALSLTILACCALLASAVAAAKCSAPPLNLPYREISVVPGILHAGIPLQIGSPWQTIALVPSLQIDDTFLPRYTNTCVYDAPLNTTTTQTPLNETNSHAATTNLSARDASPSPGSFSSTNKSDTATEEEDWWTKCAQTYGGAYNAGLSPTFLANHTNSQALDSFTDVWRFADYADVYARTNDAVPPRGNLTSTFQLAAEGKTFGGYGSALLGLTPNASVLYALHEAAMVPSTSWTLTNESLCLGCEDRAASTGAWHAFRAADREAELPCLVEAKVEALNWRPREHGVEGVTLIQETFTACVDPGVKFLVLPTNATATFEKVVRREVLAEYDDYTVFDGSSGNDTGVLTFRIEGGLEVNVTVPGAGDVGTGGEGEWTVPIGKGGWGAYGNQTWVLGKPFTDRVVLRWDGEKNEYGIANRNADAARTADIQPLGCDTFPNIEKSITSTPGTGILVGSVVGGFIGGLVFAFAGFWFFKRGQKGVRSKYAQLDEDTVPMRTMSHGRDSWMTAGTLSPPPPSIHESLASQSLRDTRPGAQSGLGFEVADSQMYEAPEGGTAYPTKRGRSEM